VRTKDRRSDFGGEDAKSALEVSHPSLEKNEGWGALTFVLSSKMGHAPTRYAATCRLRPGKAVWTLRLNCAARVERRG
jgi:hypothetical protein